MSSTHGFKQSTEPIHPWLLLSRQSHKADPSACLPCYFHFSSLGLDWFTGVWELPLSHSKKCLRVSGYCQRVSHQLVPVVSFSPIFSCPRRMVSSLTLCALAACSGATSHCLTRLLGWLAICAISHMVSQFQGGLPGTKGIPFYGWWLSAPPFYGI